MPDRRWTSQNCLGEIRFSGDPPQTRITQHVEKSTTMFFEAESDACHPSDTLTDDGEARNDFLDDRKELYLSSSVPKGESFPTPLRFFCTWSGEQILSWTCCWKAVLTILGTLMVTGFGPVSRSLQRTSPDEYTWSRGRLTKIQAT